MEKEKNKWGRPLKFKTPKELKTKVKDYFQRCDDWKIIKKISWWEVVSMNVPIPYTVEGLCVYLDIDRKTLLNYQWEREWQKELDSEFVHTVKNAKQKILSNMQERALLWESNPAVSIFNLKNNYWFKDQTHVESNNTHQVAQVNFEFKEASHENIGENWEENEKK